MSIFQDSTGRGIGVNDKVVFRGRVYTIAKFIPGEGVCGTARIEFVEPCHTKEPADEIKVDRVY